MDPAPDPATENAEETTDPEAIVMPLSAKERYLLKIRGANPDTPSGPVEQVFDAMPTI